MLAKKLILSKNYCITNIESETSLFCNFLHLGKKLEHLRQKEFNKDFQNNTIFDHRLTTPLNEIDANNIKDELNNALAKWLNNFHKKNYSEHQWAVILYPFISLYVDHIYVMYERIKFLLDNFEINEIILDEVEYNFQHTPKNVDEFISIISDIDFNNFLFNQLLSNIPDLKNKTKNVKKTIFEKSNLIIQNPSDTTLYVAKNFKSIMRDFAHRVFKFIPFRAKQPLIIGSFLPYFQDFLFKIVNLSSPRLVKTPPYKKSFADLKIREEINFGLERSPFEKFIFTSVKYFLPTSYIEDFGIISLLMRNQKWPKFPKYIFTSNNYFWDEPFKAWAAEKLYEGIPIIIGQHGNNFGTNTKYRSCPEERISSKFLTWGWKRNPKHIPFAVLKTIGRRRFGKSYGGVLFVISTNDNRTSPISFIMNTHLSRLISASNAVNFLDTAVKRVARIRLLHKNLTINGNESIFFEKNNQDSIVEYGETPFIQSISFNRLIVFCYDSTGMLECISINKPCVCLILEVDLLVLENEAKILYQELIEAGIYYTDPALLSGFINKNWNNIYEWWIDKNRQDILKRFSGSYANSVTYPIFKLHKILKSVCE